ncbi:MAG: hypothetical protein P8X58_15000 [Syntrophobacterales bacterium]
MAVERLSDDEVRVLQSRTYEGDVVRYELRHDRYIPIIANWRDQVLRNIRRWRNAISTAVILILMVFGVLLVDGYILHRNTVGVMTREDLSSQGGDREELMARKFDQVANYLIWTRTWYNPYHLVWENRFDYLKKILIKYGPKLPKNYGIERSGVEFITLPSEQEDWPLTVSYSSSRGLNPFIFTQMWQSIATTLLNKKWGIPVPLKLRLIKEDIPKEQIKLTRPHIKEPKYFNNIPAYEDKAFIRCNPKNLLGTAQIFFERFRGEWIKIDPKETKEEKNEEESGESIWVIPRWSLPAWKASGETIYDGSALPAYILVYRLVSHLELLLTPDAMEILLEKVAKMYPETVAEARAVRGDQLLEDIQEINYRMILEDRDLLNQLPTILDALAN